MNLKQKQILLNRSVWLVVIPILAGTLLVRAWLFYLSMGLAAIWVLLSRKLWCCPACGKNLGRTNEKISFCPHCGQDLNLD